MRFAQWRDVLSKQAWLQAGEQVVHGQQGMDLGGAEPQAGQIEYRLSALIVVAIAALGRIPLNRGVHAVPQVVEVALDRCLGDAAPVQ